MNAPTDPENARLEEARFRARMIAEFAARDAADRAAQARVAELERLLVGRDTTIHTLHLELADREKARAQDILARARASHAAVEDLAWFARHLKAREDQIEVLRPRAEALGGISWRLARLLGLAPRPRPMAVTPVAPAGAFTYYLHTSPFRVFRAPGFPLRGWAWPADGRAMTGVRVRIGDREFIARHGLEEAEVIAYHGRQPANPRPGFEVSLEIPAGRSLMSLEGQVENGPWLCIMATALWRPAETD